MATPLPGFLPGTIVTPIFGQDGGMGQVQPNLQMEEYTYATTGVVVLTTAGVTILNRTGEEPAIIDSLSVGDIGGGSTVTLRLYPSTVTPTGTTYTIVAAFVIGSALIVNFASSNTPLLVPTGWKLDAVAGANSRLNAIATYRTSRHQ